MNRRTKLSLMIAGPILLIGALLIVDMTMLEPYLQYKAFVNRRTGANSEYEVHCDYFAKPYSSNLRPLWIDISPYGKLTAPDIEVPASTVVYKHHFWSARRMDDQIEHEYGSRLEEVFYFLFTDLYAKKLPREQVLELIRRRIEIWNSDFPERATSEDIEKLQAENALLFSRPAR